MEKRRIKQLDPIHEIFLFQLENVCHLKDIEPVIQNILLFLPQICDKINLSTAKQRKCALSSEF